jgi:hypothetical protein
MAIPFNPGRRQAVARITYAGLGSLLLPDWLKGASAPLDAKRTARPYLLWRADPTGKLRTVAAVRASVERPGLAQQIWQAIQAECKKETNTDALTCRSLIPGRMPVMAQQNNPDYTICHAAGQRILRNALALQITGEVQYKQTALAQLEALFDESVWPDWIDQAHLRFNLPADLRTGMLSQDCGIAYDWLYPFLNDKQRKWIVEGIDRRGIQPFLKSMEADPWWSHDLNNWYTVIIGGVGIAGMALAGDHPKAAHLIDLSKEYMQRYLAIYGSDGSFNESVVYSSSTRYPVAYFNALYYHLNGASNPLSEPPFPETALWTLYATLPGARFAALGDGLPEIGDKLGFITAIAAANRDPIIQDLATRHLTLSSDPYALLGYDPELPSESPEGNLPLGKVFPENSGLVFSRSSWDPQSPEMIVYGKARQAQNHGHNDLGQVCIDVGGVPMIIDTTTPSIYPEDFFNENRYRYYNASVTGHNVLKFGGREQRTPPANQGVKGLIDMEPYSGRYLETFFDDTLGGYWQIDLTPAYAGVERVRRTVVHLLPGYVAVLDEAILMEEEEISLRWHTVVPSMPDPNGNFLLSNAGHSLACHVSAIQGTVVSLAMNRHAYAAPYNRDRTGQLLEQRNEPFVELIQQTKQTRILSLFASQPSIQPANWTQSADTWSIQNSSGKATVTCRHNSLQIEDANTNRVLAVTLK